MPVSFTGFSSNTLLLLLAVVCIAKLVGYIIRNSRTH